MSGDLNPTKEVTATGDLRIDGILSDTAWAGDSITYSIATDPFIYHYNDTTLPNTFVEISAQQHLPIGFSLDADTGTAADDGFSLEGFTNLNLTEDTTADRDSPEHIRFAGTFDSSVPTAQVADFPRNDFSDELDDNGDIWFGTSEDYTNPVAGNYAWMTHIHEIGHALGLTHGHDKYGGFGARVPKEYDSMELTVMSYRSYIGGSVFGSYTNEEFGYAQSWMMFDIAALQHMYGADYTTNSGNTVYSWDPDSGNTLVNGDVAIAPGANRIFATIWDGGGTDTYDLSAYDTDLVLDLAAGGFNTFSRRQLADLGDGNDARGNIFNALLFEGNLASLIENALGGAGNDTITGNQIRNRLTGNGGADTLAGGEGGDVLTGGGGNDTLTGGKGTDKLTGSGGQDLFVFFNTASSAPGSKRDVIRDFEVADGSGSSFVDRIDVSAIDARISSSGNNGFEFIQGDAFDAEGQIRVTQSGDDAIVEFNTQGADGAEMSIRLEDFDAADLSGFDFVL